MPAYSPNSLHRPLLLAHNSSGQAYALTECQAPRIGPAHTRACTPPPSARYACRRPSASTAQSLSCSFVLPTITFVHAQARPCTALLQCTSIMMYSTTASPNAHRTSDTRPPSARAFNTDFSASFAFLCFLQHIAHQHACQTTFSLTGTLPSNYPPP